MIKSDLIRCDAMRCRRRCSDEKWMHEPAVSGLLRQEQGVGGGGPKWRRRRPRWLVAEKVYLNLEWRASQVCVCGRGAG